MTDLVDMTLVRAASEILRCDRPLTLDFRKDAAGLLDNLRDEITRLQSALTEAQAQVEAMRGWLNECLEREYNALEPFNQSKHYNALKEFLSSTPPTAVARVIEAAWKFIKSEEGRSLLWHEPEVNYPAHPEAVELANALAGLDGGRKG